MDVTMVQQEMQEIFAELTESEQKQVLEITKTILATNHGWEHGRTSIEQYNREIDEALEEVAAGNYITQEQMEKQSAQWHRK
jgi:hypothetical protein